MSSGERTYFDNLTREARSDLDSAIERFAFAVTADPPWPELAVFARADLLYTAERWARVKCTHAPAAERFRATREGRQLYEAAERAREKRTAPDRGRKGKG